MVVCNKCQCDKEIEDFYSSKTSKSGIRHPCRGCIKEEGKQKRSEYQSVQKVVPKEKVCGTCNELKPAKDFAKRADTPTGLRSDCKACIKVKGHANYEKNKEHILASIAEYRRKNPTLGAKWTREYRARNPEHCRQLEANWRNNNRDRLNNWHRENRKCLEVKSRNKLSHEKYLSNPVNLEKKKESSRAWRARNKDKVCFYSSKRRSDIVNATPPWADMDIIKDFHKEAQYHNMEVDHIIPLTHPLVCGLHCEFNLQLLTKSENCSKNNSFEIQEHEVPEYLEFTYVEVGNE